MKFLLLICVDPSLAGPVDVRPWLDDLHERNVRLEGHQLRSSSAATTLRERGQLITDGPYAETKEQIAGYDIIDCSGLDEAIEIAAQHPCAAIGAIEVRPFWS